MQSVIECRAEAMTGYRPGIEARRAILRELARREAEAAPWPRIRELGDLLGLHFSTVRQHINTLQAAGLVERDGYQLHLTDCGRGAAETLIDS